MRVQQMKVAKVGCLWHCYSVIRGKAYSIFDSPSLTECRRWARCAGVALTATQPDAPWANIG
jgi:hypothetical protein